MKSTTASFGSHLTRNIVQYFFHVYHDNSYHNSTIVTPWSSPSDYCSLVSSTVNALDIYNFCFNHSSTDCNNSAAAVGCRQIIELLRPVQPTINSLDLRRSQSE